ncbi:lytic transglycosylase domain-containing protein [Pajaroellobacter abortibovis]|uniref:Transglycosylase SLT domain-containing protein n=1 Tax=Pajaroellobacter abortibovis TaxID=1882918 RepID=A0A1L6MV63_9BACT|nr:lytic transglycosylase domain-containing protein [Pajaroellobacter abortibovis]APR99371.1 hypothetical protein BCY86_00760 [Pajaroellobacter abortibovis]
MRWWVVAYALLWIPADLRASIVYYRDKEGGIHFTNLANHKDHGKHKAHHHYPAHSGSIQLSKVEIAPIALTQIPLLYRQWIEEASRLYQIPQELIHAVIQVESYYNPHAVSPAGARGLMQLMPATAREMGVRDIDHPRENIFGGVRFLRILANQFEGDLERTLAAYNAGPGSVEWHGGIPPYAETIAYVAKVKHLYERARKGVGSPSVPVQGVGLPDQA